MKEPRVRAAATINRTLNLYFMYILLLILLPTYLLYRNAPHTRKLLSIKLQTHKHTQPIPTCKFA